MIANRCSRIRRTSISGLVLASVVTACDQPTGAIPAEAVGTYTLVSVNGGGLPALVEATTERRVEIVSGELVVLLGGVLREERVIQITDASGTTTESTFLDGTLHVRAWALEAHAEGGARYTGFYTHSALRTELTYIVPVVGAEISYTYRQNSGR